MSELSKQDPLVKPDPFALVPAGSPPTKGYVEIVAKALTVMVGSGLKTWGLKPREMADGWSKTLFRHRITPAEIVTGADYFCDRGTDLPSAGEFGQWCVAMRTEKVSAEQLAEAGMEAAAESAERVRAFEQRMIDLYGDCSRETIRKHVEAIERQPEKRSGMKRASRVAILPTEAEVIDLEARRRMFRQIG